MLIKNHRERFVYSEHTSDKKALNPNLLNRKIEGLENQILIRENLDYKHRYEVYVTKIGEKYKHLYVTPRAKATTVITIAERFKIQLG